LYETSTGVGTLTTLDVETHEGTSVHWTRATDGDPDTKATLVDGKFSTTEADTITTEVHVGGIQTVYGMKITEVVGTYEITAVGTETITYVGTLDGTLLYSTITIDGLVATATTSDVLKDVAYEAGMKTGLENTDGTIISVPTKTTELIETYWTNVDWIATT